MRKRSRPKKELIVGKTLEPGESYVIRVPGKEEGSLEQSVAPGTPVAVIDAAGDEGSITSQLLSTATELIGAAAEPAEKPAEGQAPPKLSRRQRRKAARSSAVTVDVAPAEATKGSQAPTLVEVAAGLAGSDDDALESHKLGRRKRRRAARLATLGDIQFDRDTLPRRRRRKLDRTERRAQKRPSRKRVRGARKQQKRAAKSYARVERRSQPSRRRRRKLKAAERDLERRRASVTGRSTRRRRRKLRKAEKKLARRRG